MPTKSVLRKGVLRGRSTHTHTHWRGTRGLHPHAPGACGVRARMNATRRNGGGGGRRGQVRMVAGALKSMVGEAQGPAGAHGLADRGEAEASLEPQPMKNVLDWGSKTLPQISSRSSVASSPAVRGTATNRKSAHGTHPPKLTHETRANPVGDDAAAVQRVHA